MPFSSSSVHTAQTSSHLKAVSRTQVLRANFNWNTRVQKFRTRVQFSSVHVLAYQSDPSFEGADVEDADVGKREDGEVEIDGRPAHPAPQQHHQRRHVADRSHGYDDRHHVDGQNRLDNLLRQSGSGHRRRVVARRRRVEHGHHDL